MNERVAANNSDVSVRSLTAWLPRPKGYSDQGYEVIRIIKEGIYDEATLPVFVND